MSGPPIFKIRADDPDIGSQLQLLTEAVTWVYLSGFDIEARHRLFSGELARGDRPGQSFADSLARGLDSAKIAYEAHVHSASRETLKALADLRKTVIEEAQEAGIEPSVGSVGDSYDNALAETINGLYKAELIHRRGPWRSFEAVEFATLTWVDWFNNRQLLEPIGNIPPAEAEERYYAMLDEPAIAA